MSNTQTPICIEAESREEAEREIRRDYPKAEFKEEVITKIIINRRKA